MFGRYVPDFDYYLVPVHMYSKEELLAKGDEISLVMLMNRMQTAEDIEEFRTISPERIDDILSVTPEYRREKMADILKAFLLKINMPLEEAEGLVSKVKEKEMGELFANIDKMDIQEERRKTAEARRELEDFKKEAKEETIRIAIEMLKDFGTTKEAATQKIMEKFKLTENEANEKTDRYWEKDGGQPEDISAKD